MANPDHEGILKQGAEAWNRWRRNSRDLLPDLSAADLHELYLPDADLERADLRAEKIAKEIKVTRSANMVLLGAASPFMPVAAEVLEAAVSPVFGRKGEKIVAQNVEAFRRGRAAVEEASEIR